MAKYSPYKMKGHTLPGIKQKQSPAKIAPLIAMAGKAILGQVAGKVAGKVMGGKKEEE